MNPNYGEVFTNLLAGGFIGFSLIIMIVIFVFIILLLIGRIALFRKAGIAGWKAIIPFYSDYLMDVKVCGLHWAFFIAEEFLTFGSWTQVINILIRAMRYYNLAMKCHKDPIPSTIFGALFPSIVEMVYGISSNTIYDQNEPVGNCGFFNKVVK